MTPHIYAIQVGSENPILRKKSVCIDVITKEITTFAHILLDSMWKYDGVGLAAPQIGKNIQMIAVTQRKKSKESGEEVFVEDIIMINPTITELSEQTIVTEEGCLSLPGITGKVRRHKYITIQYTDLHGIRHKKKYKDFNAIIIQHEMDHLVGILFIDKIEDNKI